MYLEPTIFYTLPVPKNEPFDATITLLLQKILYVAFCKKRTSGQTAHKRKHAYRQIKRIAIKM
jgi:hypothetical protein